MALQMVRSFFGQGTPSRSRAHEPIIGIESLGNQEGNSSYDTGDVGKSAASNWFELARHPTSELGRKPHIQNAKLMLFSNMILTVGSYSAGVSLEACCAAFKGDIYDTFIYVFTFQ